MMTVTTAWISPLQDPGVSDRFWSKVDKDGPVPEARPDLGPCWMWTGSLSTGYGKLSVGGRPENGGREFYAHVLAWEDEHGPTPDGLELDHLCRRGGCIRPSHLEAVTHLENILRAEHNPWCAQKTHCPQGHPYDAANTRWYRQTHGPGWGRQCRACDRERKNLKRLAEGATPKAGQGRHRGKGRK